MTLGEVIKHYRVEHGLSMDSFASVSGLSKAYISMLERNQNPKTGQPITPSIITFKCVAAAMNITLDKLLAMVDENHPVYVVRDLPAGFIAMPKMTSIPRVGQIACGTPILAEENLEGTTSVPEEWNATFALKCYGDSMAPRIEDGDYVAIRKQDTVENGQIAAVRIDGEATLKHVYVYRDYIELRPENPAYESIIKIGPAMNEVHIEGLAVGLCRGLCPRK